MSARFPLLDVALAGVLTVLAFVEALSGLTVEPSPWYVALTVPFVTGPILVRRTHAAAAALVSLLALIVQAALGSDLGGGFAEFVVLVVVLYSAGARLAVRLSLVVLGAALLSVAIVVALGDGAHPGNVVYAGTVVVGAWLAGRGVRLADERSELLAERREMQERGRIARELHDVVSHNVSAIVVQAGAERRDLPASSPAATAFGDIERHGRETLHELRRLLGVLRLDPEAPPLAPQPGVADLSRLVETTRATGLDVAFDCDGESTEVDDGLGLTVYRVVQESLTNARKHAQDPRVAVRLRWSRHEIEIEVTSFGRRRGGVPGAGYGLAAMAERVRAYGGQLDAAPTVDGFRVHAVLPLGGLA